MSLAGRFFLHRCMHWGWQECRDAFGWTLPQWIFFGGYPGAAPWARREDQWRRFVADSLVETALELYSAGGAGSSRMRSAGGF